MNNLSFIPTTCIRLFFGLILANSFMLHEVYAQFLDPNIQIQQQIRQENEDLQRRRQADEINRAHQKSQHLSGSAKEKEFIDDGKCRIIKKFEISGNQELSLKNLSKFTIASEGKCLTKIDLDNIKKAIENDYLSKSYMLARVYFDLKHLASGLVGIVVEEGKANSFEIKDDSKINDTLSYRRNLQKFFAFGLTDEKVVNLRDIEQGLDQINRLSSNNAKLDLTPAVGDGYSDIIINNQVKNISKPSIGINNSGNESTGRTRENFVLDQDNLIGVNDNIYFLHSTSDNNSVNRKYFKSNYLSISLPFTYYTFGANYSDSKYLTTTKSTFSTNVSSGDSQSSSYYVSRVLSRDKKYKISLKAELNKATNNNYLNSEFQEVNSRTLTVAKLFLDNVYYTPLGSIFLQPKYNKGTKLMNAAKDKSDLNADTQRAQFNSYGLYGLINNNFLLPKTQINLNHNLTFDSQISKNRLFNSEQMAIGGRYTVRGFAESSISGDSGYYIKNDLGANVFQLMPNVIKNSFATSLLQKLSAGVFYDYGYVRNKIVNDKTDEGYMSGGGARLNYNGEYFKVDLTYSKGLHSPQFLRNINHILEDNESIYLDIKFGLL